MICPACQHDDRTDIDVQLSQGAPLSGLSAMFGLSVNVLKKHQDQHLRGVAVRISTEPGSVIFDLERHERILEVVLQMAAGIKNPDHDPDDPKSNEYIRDPNPNLILKTIAEIREMKVTMVKLAKELAMFKRDTVSRDTFNQMIDIVLKAAENHPDILATIESALAELPV